jgi:hypothetical protein
MRPAATRHGVADAFRACHREASTTDRVAPGEREVNHGMPGSSWPANLHGGMKIVEASRPAAYTAGEAG